MPKAIVRLITRLNPEEVSNGMEITAGAFQYECLGPLIDYLRSSYQFRNRLTSFDNSPTLQSTHDSSQNCYLWTICIGAASECQNILRDESIPLSPFCNNERKITTKVLGILYVPHDFRKSSCNNLLSPEMDSFACRIPIRRPSLSYQNSEVTLVFIWIISGIPELPGKTHKDHIRRAETSKHHQFSTAFTPFFSFAKPIR